MDDAGGSDGTRGVLERGDAAVWVRPALDADGAPDTLVEVADLLVTLAPDDDAGPGARLVEIGRKRFPADPDQQPNWGFVRAVGDRGRIHDALGRFTYDTETLGRRTVPAAQRAAHGHYELTRRGRNTLLALDLEVDRELDDALLAQLHVPERAQYLLNVKNPAARDPEGAGLEPERRAEYPDELQRAFDGNRWTAADPVALLDHEGAEFILVASNGGARK